jgi:hypothetical protein
MTSRETFFRKRAAATADMAKAAEAMDFNEIAGTYRKAEKLWLEMAEQAKRVLDEPAEITK